MCKLVYLEIPLYWSFNEENFCRNQYLTMLEETIDPLLSEIVTQIDAESNLVLQGDVHIFEDDIPIH